MLERHGGKGPFAPPVTPGFARQNNWLSGRISELDTALTSTSDEERRSASRSYGALPLVVLTAEEDLAERAGAAAF